jgi:NTP pyrophosphatase (non-canonical NTP hydrolase)
MTLDELQALIESMYSRKDRERGTPATFLWFCEEVGELAAALREGTHDQQCAEFADVLAWLATLANVSGVNLAEAVQKKYGTGCPGCGQMICGCEVKP